MINTKIKNRPDISQSIWRSPSCNERSYTLDDVIAKIQENAVYTIHVGTDSHLKRGTKNSQTFATVICLLSDSRGAHYFYTKDDVPNSFNSLHDRILEEASRSITVAQKIRDCINNKKIVIHSDTNTNFMYPTAKCTDVIRKWVTSLGLDIEFVAKPDAWASTCVADMHSK